MIFEKVRAGDQTGSLTVDFASAGTRFLVRVLNENPDLLACIVANLDHFEKYAGYNPNVVDTAQAAEVLKKFTERS